MSHKGKLQNLHYFISADIEHGECFYDKEMFDVFCKHLDNMKEVAKQYFDENQRESEDEDEE